jgi:cell division protein FtsZ
MSSNEEYDISFDLPKNQSNSIKVIGVGGGGSNAINHMFQQGIRGVDFVVCNTDAQALENSPVPTKIQLGVGLTEGLGAGANPDIGRQAAEESFEELQDMLDRNTKMVFITAGMGGGTGTGAAPIIARQAKEMDLLTVGIVTSPFQFEGRTRNAQAQIGVEELRNNVDSLIVINNNKLREVYGNLGFKAGFSKADEVLATASRGIAEVITHHYTQNIDLRDAKTVLSNSGTAIMGSAVASGTNRAQEAIMKALDSPLLNDNKISGSQNVLLLIVSGTAEITIDEIGEINDHIQGEAGHSANIIMGVGDDEDLAESIAVTIIATGFDHEQQNDIVNTEAKKIIHTLEDEQKATQNLSPKPDTGFSHQSNYKPKPKQEKKVYNLEDEKEDEAPKNEVPDNTEEKVSEENQPDFDYDNYNEEEFVITDSKENDVDDVDDIDDVDEIVETEETETVRSDEQAEFEFDLPKPSSPETEEKQDDPEVEGKEVYEGENGDDEENRSEQIVFQLNEEEDSYGDKSKPKHSSSEKSPHLKTDHPVNESDDRDEENPFESNDPFVKKSDEAKKTKPETEKEPEQEEIDPCDHPISEELINRAAERRAKMKNFNYKFRKNSNIDEIEKQPAYKRAGMDMDESSAPLNEKLSRTSIDEDDDDQLRMRKNNSFLHDNVD